MGDYFKYYIQLKQHIMKHIAAFMLLRLSGNKSPSEEDIKNLLKSIGVGFVPSNLKGKKIFSIEQHKKVLESAGPGNSVGLSIKGIAKDEKVSPGDIIYNENDGELKPIKSFTALD